MNIYAYVQQLFYLGKRHMTVYLFGVIAAIIVFMAVGVYAGRRVKDTNDYYVAGRKAPVLLIVGSLIASFLSTGAFMGDTGEVYSGFFMGIVVVGVLQSLGYVYGANLFGKYIRRSRANTVPEYFGSRFESQRLRRLASATLMVAVTAYMLSALQGVSTLMTQVTGLSYNACVILAWAAFTVFTVWSGSRGVLITDTMMFLIFLAAAMVGIPYIVHAAGGWSSGIAGLARSESCPGILAWTNNLDYLYPTGAQNLVWGIVYGVVWAIVVMVSPWQTSRYLMAKDEHTVVRSSVWASIGVCTVTMALYFSAAFVYQVNPDLEDASTNLIWAATHLMPTAVGVLMLTGILSAGISSASTFLSLIGSSLTNDLLPRRDSETSQLRVSRVGMAAVSVIVLLLGLFNPPQIFWIMYFGGTVIAASWGIVALASVWCPWVSENGAFWGMLLGFLGCAVPKAWSALNGVTLPIWLDPFFIGVLCSVLGLIIGSRLRKPGTVETERYGALHVRPASECSAEEDRKTHRLMWVYIAYGVLLGCVFVFAYALPYMRALAE